MKAMVVKIAVTTNTILLCAATALAMPSKEIASKGKNGKVKIRYKSSKEINFEQLLIQGKLKRPDLSVVTGSIDSDDFGLLRLRKDFLDRVSLDFGEEAK